MSDKLLNIVTMKVEFLNNIGRNTQLVFEGKKDLEFEEYADRFLSFLRATYGADDIKEVIIKLNDDTEFSSVNNGKYDYE